MTDTVDAPYWGREDEPDAAHDRLLDAAGPVFVERGVATAGMSQVATAAGCSRGTLYRYFPSAAALRLAFVEREAVRVGGRVALAVGDIDDPADLLVEVCLRSLDEVRIDPVLSAWFDPSSSGLAGELAGQAASIRRLVDDLLTVLFDRAEAQGRLRPDLDRGLAADWVVRVLLSLLAQPAGPSGQRRSGPATERALLRQCLLPALFLTDD